MRYKGAYGGRGSGKSHFFAEMLVDQHVTNPGLRSACVREVQKTLKESAKQLIETKIKDLGVGHLFRVLDSEIRTPGGGKIIFTGLKDHTADSIKSLEEINICWVEEGQSITEKSWKILRPTIRAENSEIWVSWNPRRRIDPVDQFFRQESRSNTICVKANWRDNPWFPQVLEDDRRDDEIKDPDGYDHVWEGDYVTVIKGAYYAESLKLAKKQKRISFVPVDPNLRVHAFWDIGGPGKKADAMTVVIAQFVDQRINVLDYIEGVGQVLGYYTAELRDRGWGKAYCVVPHDAAQTHADNPTGMDFEAQLRKAGFSTEKVHSPPGIVMQRIATTRKWFPRIWFNEATTEALRSALGWFHERWDEERDVGLGPDHDWSSHGADAFGLMCIFYKEPRKTVKQLAIPDYGAA